MKAQPKICSTNGPATAPLEVYLLGVVDFESALFLQERLVYEIAGRNDALGGLLICEHPPMITIGREGSRDDISAETGELIARQMEVRWVNRGGGCLVHSPGQLAVYPIVPLDRLKIGLSEYRGRLQETLIDVCRELRVSAWRREDEPGLWCRTGRFADLGVAVKSWVAYHGMFVNVSAPLDIMRLAASDDRRNQITSLTAQRARMIQMHTVRESVIRNLTTRLEYKRLHLYTGHPLLRQMKQRTYVNA